MKVEATSVGIDRQEGVTTTKFLDMLYDKTASWLLSRGATAIHTFQPQQIPGFEKRDRPFQLEKAVIFRDERKIFALVVGTGIRAGLGKYRSLRFGFLPAQAVDFNLPTIRDINRLCKPMLYFGYGAFHTPSGLERGRLTIDCWVDDKIFGERNIHNWSQKRLLTEDGADACLWVIQETCRRASTGQDLR